MQIVFISKLMAALDEGYLPITIDETGIGSHCYRKKAYGKIGEDVITFYPKKVSNISCMVAISPGRLEGL